MTLTPYLFEELEQDRIINVASVPQRSPFRYPGGKTWLVPYIRQWLKSLPYKIDHFIEPFCGGGIISLTVAFEQLADHITMVELDNQVAAVWKAILYGDGEWLANEISGFDLNFQIVKELLSKNCLTVKEKALQTIVKNRVNRGGILASGAGMVKNGENGKGIASRWYPETLKKRILDIITVKNRITFIEGNGVEVIRQNTSNAKAAFFIDPPYTVAGKKAGNRLYAFSELDHNELFRIVSNLRGKFLMTYDDTQEIRDLAKVYNFEVANITMKNTHHAKMTELLISQELGWVFSFSGNKSLNISESTL